MLVVLRRFSRWLVLVALMAAATQARSSLVSTMPFNFRHKIPFRLFYQKGNSEADIPDCGPMSVCNRVDTYSTPWIERQCRCPGRKICPMSLDPHDGHTVVDKSRQFKLCQPVSKLPTCRYFKDVAWVFESRQDNTTQQTMHCICPKNSVAYIIKHQAYQTDLGELGYRYFFACSPQSKLRCQRKEPCRLFTVKKRPDVEQVNTNTLCQCPHGHKCPKHHSEASVILDATYPDDHIRTYTGYCSDEIR